MNHMADGRLHLHHGPIDLIIEAFGPGREQAHKRAAIRFDGLLQELVADLPELRTPLDQGPQPTGPIALQMLAAVQPYDKQFVTPLAAVAGAVADAVLAEMRGEFIRKSYVNNGGDIAVFLTENESFIGQIPQIPTARIKLTETDPWRGIATSGWQGRSHSLGIADNVTVVAQTAAQADVAATLIANAVDLPGHKEILRQAANNLSPDSDLGDRLVTTSVGTLSRIEVVTALQRGIKYADKLMADGLIGGALLALKGQFICSGQAGIELKVTREIEHV